MEGVAPGVMGDGKGVLMALGGKLGGGLSATAGNQLGGALVLTPFTTGANVLGTGFIKVLAGATLALADACRDKKLCCVSPGLGDSCIPLP